MGPEACQQLEASPPAAHISTCNMVSLPSQSLVRASRTIARSNGWCSTICGIQQRSFAAAGNDGTLPLKGFKVLDMTRVLAGVWKPNIPARCFANEPFSAILHTDFGGLYSLPFLKFQKSFTNSLQWGTAQQPQNLFHKLIRFSAEVIKVEHPTKGDDTRQWGPPYAKYKEGSGKEGPGESAYFLSVSKVPTSLPNPTAS